MKSSSVTQSTYRYLDSLPRVAVVSGWGLFEVMYQATGRKTTPGTLLGYLRDWGELSGHTVECIDRRESRYRIEKAGPWGIAGALVGD